MTLTFDLNEDNAKILIRTNFSLNLKQIQKLLSGKKQLEAFEMWIWRTMLQISWKDKVANAPVLESEKHVEYNMATKTQMAGTCA